jgi:hypothetical protein
MKTKILRISAIASILALACLVLLPTPALALPEVTLSPTSGAVGTRVTVTGSGFESFSGTEVEVLFDDTELDLSPLLVDDDGTFAIEFDVPPDTEPGVTQVKVRALLGAEIRETFIVQEPRIDLSSSEGPVGTEVTVEGRGFYSGGNVDLYYYQDEDRVSIATEESSSIGEVTFVFSIPDSMAGEHRILVEDVIDNVDKADFEVVPTLMLSQTAGAIGDDLTVSGSGFGEKSEVTIYFDNAVVVGATTNKYGSFEVDFKVPAVESGAYRIEGEDEEDNQAEADFTVAAGASLSQDSGAVGTSLIVSGVGFKAGTIVAISYDGVDVTTAVTDGHGAFSIPFQVPASSGGNHVVRITDGSNTAECIFTMESEAPWAPALLLPEQDTKSSARVRFVWEEVDDPSGVTYLLEVATKESFAANSIVLEKTELVGTEYTLTEEEELEPSTREAPHYWRVKAIDGAANESAWSAVGSFYVGSSFTLSPTMKNVLIGLGVGGAVALGIWVGRRTAYTRPRT